jgi:homoserine dehydrogenase
VGDVMFSGRGAGSDPTGSAVIGDFLDVGRNIANGGSGSAIPYDLGMNTANMDDLETAYYLRMIVADQPNTLGEIAMVFGKYGISIAEMQMKTLPSNQGEIVFLTHEAVEREFQKALSEVAKLPCIVKVATFVRVDG